HQPVGEQGRGRGTQHARAHDAAADRVAFDGPSRGLATARRAVKRTRCPAALLVAPARIGTGIDAMREAGHVVGRGHQARRWIVAGCYLMAAPLLPVGAGFFYAGQGPTPASLAVTVVAGATAVL